ncbi:MAG: phage tail length tape measure family protein [Paludibacter sp.]
MAAQTSQGILELVDKISSPMKTVMTNTTTASHGVEKLGSGLNGIAGKMGSIASMPGKILGTLGIGFGMFQFVSMMEKGIEKAHQLHEAEALVKAGLISTGGAAGMSYQAIEENVKKISSAANFSKAELMNMQSLLVTFPNITKDTFGTASQAITDMSAKMHTDLSSSAIQVGKALQDPVLGVTALRRVGVNFNKEQTDVIKNLVANGNIAEAQTKILTELNHEFGGSAKAAFDANPLARYNKAIGGIQVQMGTAVIKIQEMLGPALLTVATFLKDVFTKVADNMQPIMNAIEPIWVTISTVFQTAWSYVSAFLGEIGGVIGFLTGTKTSGDGVVDTMRTIGSVLEYLSYPIKALGDMLVFMIDKFGFVGIGYGIITAGQWLWNAALAANPIGLVIAGVAVLVGTIMYAWDKFGVFRGGIMATWETIKGFGNIIKEYVIDRIQGILSGFGGIAKAIGQLFSKDYKGAWATAKQASADLLGITADQNVLKNASEVGKKIGSAYQLGVSEVATNDKKKAAADAAKKKDTDLSKGGVSPIIQPTNLGGGGSGKGGLSGSGGGVGGVKTINQKIDIKNYFTVSGGADVEAIAATVVRAINDRLRDATVALQ